MQAAVYSASTFTIGAALPLLIAWITPLDSVILAVATASLMLLAVTGALAAQAGGAPVIRAAIRVAFWGALAMSVTALVGVLFEAAI